MLTAVQLSCHHHDVSTKRKSNHKTIFDLIKSDFFLIRMKKLSLYRASKYTKFNKIIVNDRPQREEGGEIISEFISI